LAAKATSSSLFQDGGIQPPQCLAQLPHQPHLAKRIPLHHRFARSHLRRGSPLLNSSGNRSRITVFHWLTCTGHTAYSRAI